MRFGLSVKGNVQVDFAFFDPKADDFHGVKTLLQTCLDDKEWDLSGFVDLILEQTTVGSVVKIEDDEDNGIFGLVTTLNLGRYKASNLYICIPVLQSHVQLYTCRLASYWIYIDR